MRARTPSSTTPRCTGTWTKGSTSRRRCATRCAPCLPKVRAMACAPASAMSALSAMSAMCRQGAGPPQLASQACVARGGSGARAGRCLPCTSPASSCLFACWSSGRIRRRAAPDLRGRRAYPHLDRCSPAVRAASQCLPPLRSCPAPLTPHAMLAPSAARHCCCSSHAHRAGATLGLLVGFLQSLAPY
jgi:hypothetical protein